MNNILKSLRMNRGMTQQMLAQQSGVTQGTISSIEHGQRGNIRTYERLAQALGVRLTDFFAETGKPSRQPTLADLLEPAQPSTELPVGNWSPTRLADWLLCPAKGAWSTGVFSLPADFQWPSNDRARMGKATHKYAEARLSGQSPNEAILQAADEAIGLDPELWLPFAEAWDQEVRPTIGTPRATEQRFEAHLGGHAVTAVIDVIDENHVIRDLKTTQRLPNAVSLARETLQAPIYTAAWAEKTGETATFALDYLVQHKSGVQSAHIPVPVGPKDIERVTQQLDYATEQAMHPEHIVPNPLTKYGCAGCAFLPICHEKFGTFVDAPVPTVAASS